MAITDPNTRIQIVLAATTAAGPGADENAVTAQVRSIIARLGEGSPAMRAFDEEEQRESVTTKVKTFRGILLHVDKEVSSTRGVIFLKTQASKWHPNGKEFLRTERTDSPAGRALAVAAQQFIGHQVTITVAIEGTGEVNVRVVRNIESNGLDPAYNPADPEYQPDFNSDKALEKLYPNLASVQAAAAAAAQPQLAGV